MKTRKILAMLMAAVLLVGASVLGTMAYLTDSTQVVKNTFTVGNVKIALDEADVNLQGEPLAAERDDQGNITSSEVVDKVANATRTEDGNAYKLMPNMTYVKDPTVTVKANSEESYVRMVVTLTHASDLVEALTPVAEEGEDAEEFVFLPENYVTGWDRTVWASESMVEDADENTITCTFLYKETVDTLDGNDLVLEPLFTEFTVPATVNNENLAKLNEVEIQVKAHAIQAAGFDDADAAWTAFDAQ